VTELQKRKRAVREAHLSMRKGIVELYQAVAQLPNDLTDLSDRILDLAIMAEDLADRVQTAGPP
jgi:hypothetical protein